jgi:predicted LPLAT superfamily acyltransferase
MFLRKGNSSRGKFALSGNNTRGSIVLGNHVLDFNAIQRKASKRHYRAIALKHLKENEQKKSLLINGMKVRYFDNS